MKALEFIGFMFFSSLEGFAVYALTLYLFRFDMKKYIRHVIGVIILVSFQNFVTRDLLSLATIAPIINLCITALFFITIMRLPFVWSLFMTLTGYATFSMLQTVIVFFSFGYLSIDEVQNIVFKGYILQSLTGLIGFFVPWSLYKRGFGFKYDFEKLRFKWEKFFIAGSIAIFILILAVSMYYRDVYVNLLAFAIALFIFLLYSIRKEASEK
jgi:hypothetical protein